MDNHANKSNSNTDPTIVCVGSIMYDIFSYVPRLPKPGESLPGCRVVDGCGGKGANPAVAASRLGAKTSMIGKVGYDSYGEKLLENFRKNGIDSRFVFKTSDATSGVGIVIVEESGENRIIVATGANLLLSVDDVRSAEGVFSTARVLNCNFETNLDAVKEALKLARKHGVKSILNAAPAVPNPDSDFYGLADFFCVNETEAEIITGSSANEVDCQQLVTVLLGRGCNNVILTMGSKGVMFVSKGEPDKVEIIEPTPVKAVDTTGAGDAFVGAFVYYLAHHPNLSVKEQLTRACQIASISVQYPGTQTSYPWRKDVPSNLFL